MNPQSAVKQTSTLDSPRADDKEMSLDHFLSASEARLSYWHKLQKLSQILAAKADPVKEEQLQLTFKSIKMLEDYCAYPGPRLISALGEIIRTRDYINATKAIRKISNSLSTNNYRHDANAWNLEHLGEPVIADALPLHGKGLNKARPYFEVLIVTSSERSSWPALHESLKALARPEDQFIYEPVIVGSFEDAILATILNFNLQAVIAYDGFIYKSENQIPMLRDQLGRYMKSGDTTDVGQDFGVRLARAIKEIRPELDFYLLTGSEAEDIAGLSDAAPIKRVFYSLEELLELHLCIMEGVSERFRTPFFDNLKKYAQRPIGTFHALPIARGKSVFKSNWIQDMGEFYGLNLFLAESSATTGGLDSLLEPAGNIKLAQEAAARAFGADQTFFATNGTSTSNKIVSQGVLRPGDIVLIDRDCHKSHHYGMVAAGAQPYYIDAYQLPQYSMYGSVPIKRIKQALLKLKAENKLDKARLVVLTNCTFDGHLANVRRTMEECLAIKPDLIFLWDEAWSGFARFSPFLRRRTAMDGAAHLRKMLKDPEYRIRYDAFKKEVGEIDPSNPAMLETRLLPDPDKTHVRVYQTNSVHKSMSALRQSSIILVADDDFSEVEESFHEAFFMHTSTSPNQQIIASLDVARRQMELEGYELVTKAIQLAIELRREINTHPLVSKYFKALTPADMIPAEYRKSGLEDYGAAHGSWPKVLQSLDEDEFCLDPTRITLLCGRAGYDGTQFKALLSDEYDIQINKTSRNSILVQLNINNTRSDLAHMIKALSDISRKLDQRLEGGDESDKSAFTARVKSLIEDVPDLPDFTHFYKAYRDDDKSGCAEGHMREAFYTASDGASCEHIKLNSKEIDERLTKGPELVSANFVIPYPPGFPIMVPGQVITNEIITYMRKLDVKEIHGYNAGQGLKIIKTEALK
jgi:arginine decarboxylase